ncbi:MAG: PD-(D/E)XK nuclease family protein [Candidatus Kerfeldbacteria bacterium]|nr:PD-(D/E)XK nuclease family protein [Candidatus Kerfeldbacteria bacterium]
MFVPEPPDLAQLERITPSIYEASMNCLAKAAWSAFGDGSALPQHLGAILGTAFHTVVAAAHKGELMVEGIGDRSPARELFDKTAQELHQVAHPLVKLKFRSAGRLPFYNLHRERSARIATPVAASRHASSASAVGAARSSALSTRTESRLCSKDGRIVGRADCIDGRSGMVIDYKTGHASEVDADASAVSDSEVRQLRLYAYLAAENEIAVDKGVIVRGDGRRCEVAIAPAEAEAEADRAREQLFRLNAAAAEGDSFHDLTSPSPRNCSFCPCIPFCGPFWAAAKPEWTTVCGSNIEGDIVDVGSRDIQGSSLTTLILSRRAGTLSAERVSVEQIPSEWLRMNGWALPCVGDAVRVVHGRQVQMDENTAVVRVDKAMTAVWRVRRGNTDGGKKRVGEKHGGQPHTRTA